MTALMSSAGMSLDHRDTSLLPYHLYPSRVYILSLPNSSRISWLMRLLQKNGITHATRVKAFSLRKEDGTLTDEALHTLRSSDACSRTVSQRSKMHIPYERCSMWNPSCCLNDLSVGKFGPCSHGNAYKDGKLYTSMSVCAAMAGEQLAMVSMLKRILYDVRKGATQRGIVWMLEDDASLLPGWLRRYQFALKERPISSWHLLKLTDTSPRPQESAAARAELRFNATALLTQPSFGNPVNSGYGSTTLGSAALAMHTDNASRVLSALDEIVMGRGRTFSSAIDFSIAMAHIKGVLDVEQTPVPVVWPNDSMVSTQTRRARS